MNIGERIKKIRRLQDLTQQEFADKIGSKRNTVATYEMGRTEPSTAIISLICREFNVNEAWLRTGVGKMFKPNPSDALSKFVQERGLSQADQAIIEKFASLDAVSRQAVVDYVLATADAIMNLAQHAPSTDQPQHPEPASPPAAELEADVSSADIKAARAEAEEYYREKLLEKRMRTSQGFSQEKSG